VEDFHGLADGREAFRTVILLPLVWRGGPQGMRGGFGPHVWVNGAPVLT